MAARRSWREIRAERASDDSEFEMRLAGASLRMDFAQLVYDLRTRAGLSQAELAERMGTTQSAIARIENSGTNPTLELIERLARATGVQVVLSVAAPTPGEEDQRSFVIAESR